MIIIKRDDHPPIENATGMWHRWDVAVITPMGNTVRAGGWTAGARSLAQSSADAVEKRLKQLHCARVRHYGSSTYLAGGGMPSGSFLVGSATKGRRKKPTPVPA